MVWTPYWLPSLPPRCVTSHFCVPSLPPCLSHPLLCTRSILSRAQGHPRAASTLVSIPTVGCKLLEGKVQLSFPERSPVPCPSLSMEPICSENWYENEWQHPSMHMWAQSSVNSNGGTELPAQHLCSSPWYFWMLRTQLTGGKRAEALTPGEGTHGIWVRSPDRYSFPPWRQASGERVIMGMHIRVYRSTCLHPSIIYWPPPIWRAPCGAWQVP